MRFLWLLRLEEELFASESPHDFELWAIGDEARRYCLVKVRQVHQQVRNMTRTRVSILMLGADPTIVGTQVGIRTLTVVSPASITYRQRPANSTDNVTLFATDACFVGPSPPSRSIVVAATNDPCRRMPPTPSETAAPDAAS